MLKIVDALGPSGYRVGVGFNVTVGDVERVTHLGSGFVAGVFTGSGIRAGIFANTSCFLFPLVTKVSGNVLGVETFTVSGLNAASSVLTTVQFTVIAEGH